MNGLFRIFILLCTMVLPVLASSSDGPPPFAAPDFDDSAWQSITLPLSPGTPPPWPGHCNGTVCYRHVFDLEDEESHYADDGAIRLGDMGDCASVWLNGYAACCRRSPFGFDAWPVRFHPLRPAGNVIAVSAPVRDGVGGIPPQEDPAWMVLWIRTLCYVTGEVCNAEIDQEWTIPLAGEWKCLFVPAEDHPSEGGAE